MKFYLKNPIVRVFICHCMQSERDLVCVLCKKFLHLLSRQLLWPVREKGRTRKTLTSICQLVDGLCDVSKTLGILQLCQNKTFQAAFSGPKVSSRQDEPFRMRALRQIYEFRSSAASTTPTYHDDLVCISSATFSFKLLALKANHPNRPG